MCDARILIAGLSDVHKFRRTCTKFIVITSLETHGEIVLLNYRANMWDGCLSISRFRSKKFNNLMAWHSVE